MKKDVFGVKGDFTTSPEISQMFGEACVLRFLCAFRALSLSLSLYSLALAVMLRVCPLVSRSSLVLAHCHLVHRRVAQAGTAGSATSAGARSGAGHIDG
jgi:hypothetical protein